MRGNELNGFWAVLYTLLFILAITLTLLGYR